MKKIKAISYNDFKNHGCINCGCKVALNTKFGNTYKCCYCDTEFAVVNPEDMHIYSAFTELDGTKYKVEHISHPRISHPTHNLIKIPKFTDKKLLKEGEEPFYSCGICSWNLTGFVPDINTGERIKNMLKEVFNSTNSGASIIEIDSIPKAYMILIGPFDNISIDKLHELIKKDGIINKDKIIKSKEL